MSNIAPFPGNPAAALTARTVVADAQLCAARPDLARLAWLVIHTNRGNPAIQSRMPRPDRPRSGVPA